jgi:hypothetical protein
VNQYGLKLWLTYIRGGIHNFQDWYCHFNSSCSSKMQQYATVLAYFESRCTEFNAAGWMCWFSTSFYMESSLWLKAVSWWILQRICTKFCVNLGKARRIFSGHEKYTYYYDSEKKQQPSHGNSLNAPRLIIAISVKRKVKSLLAVFWHKGECSQRILPDRIVSQFRILRWSCTATAWEFTKNSHQTLAKEVLDVASRRLPGRGPKCVQAAGT